MILGIDIGNHQEAHISSNLQAFSGLFFTCNLNRTLHLQGCSAKGSLSKEDAAMICVEALSVVPQGGFAFEV